MSRALSSAFGWAFWVLLLAWVFRQSVGLEGYSDQLLLIALASLFLNRAFAAEFRLGLAKAVSSFLSNLAMGSLLAAILLFMLSWVASLQGAALPAWLPTPASFVIASILLFASSVGVSRVARIPKGLRVVGPPRVFEGASLDGVEVSGKAIAFELKSTRRVGYVVLGDLEGRIDTPMGPVRLSTGAPALVIGYVKELRKAGEDEVKAVGDAEKLRQKAVALVEEIGSAAKVDIIDLPFIKVTEDLLGSEVQVGPIYVRESPKEEVIRIGPFINIRERRRERARRWLIASPGARVTRRGDRIFASWNGSRLSMVGDRLSYRHAEDSFYYSPRRIVTRSPSHVLSISTGTAGFRAGGLYIRIARDEVTIKEEGKAKAARDPHLAELLRETLASEAERHIRDLLAGVPIDLESTLAALEDALGG